MNNATKRNRRAAGVCAECGGASNGRYYCDRCREVHRNQMWRSRAQGNYKNYERNRSTERRRRAKEEGLCIRCGVRLDPIGDAGRVKCINCREEIHAS
jgi:protein-arginine kinase activator protein McsA